MRQNLPSNYGGNKVIRTGYANGGEVRRNFAAGGYTTGSEQLDLESQRDSADLGSWATGRQRQRAGLPLSIDFDPSVGSWSSEARKRANEEYDARQQRDADRAARQAQSDYNNMTPDQKRQYELDHAMDPSPTGYQQGVGEPIGAPASQGYVGNGVSDAASAGVSADAGVVGYAAGGEVYDPYQPANVNSELDRYYRDPLEGRMPPPPHIMAPQGDDTVYANTGPKWTPETYGVNLMQASAGYAKGGEVRRNFYEGGDADVDPVERARIEEQARLAAQQQPVEPPPTPRPQEPSARDPYVAETARDRGPPAELQPDEARLIDGQATLSKVMDYTRQKFGIVADQLQNRGDTGYNTIADPNAGVTPGERPPPAPTPPEAPRTGYQANEAGAAIGQVGPAENYTQPFMTIKDPSQALPTDSIWEKTKMAGLKAAQEFTGGTTSGRPDANMRQPWSMPDEQSPAGQAVMKYLRGDGGYPPEKLMQILHSDPKGDYNAPVQKTFSDLVAKGNMEEASQFKQGLRPPYDNLRGMAQAALDHGDINNAIKATKRMHDLLPNGQRLDITQGADGSIRMVSSPERGFAGEVTIKELSPSQFRDFVFSEASQFDHLADGGLARNLAILTGPAPAAPGAPAGVAGPGSAPPGAADRPDQPAASSEELGAPIRRGVAPTGYGGRRSEAEPGAAQSVAEAPGTSDATDISARRRGGGLGSSITRGEAPALPPAPTSMVPGTATGVRSASAGPGRPAAVTNVGLTGYAGRPAESLLHNSVIPDDGSEKSYGVGRSFAPNQGPLTGYPPIQGAGPIREVPRAERVTPDRTYGAPGSLAEGPMPSGGAALTRRELDAAQSMPDRAITRDRDLLQRVPEGYFDTIGGKAALERLARDERASGGMRYVGEAGKVQLAADLMDLYNPNRGARATGPIGPTAPTPEQSLQGMFKQQPLPAPGEVSRAGYEQFRPQDLATQERNRRTEQQIAPQYQAGQERQAREYQDAVQRGERNRDRMLVETSNAAARANMGMAPENLAQERKIELEQVKSGGKRDVEETKSRGKSEQITQTEAGKDRRLTQTEEGKGARLTQTEEGRGARQESRNTARMAQTQYTQEQANRRADNVVANRRENLNWLREKAAQETLQKDGSDTLKSAMKSIDTKLAQGIKLTPPEIQAHDMLVDMVMERGGKPPAGYTPPAGNGGGEGQGGGPQSGGAAGTAPKQYPGYAVVYKADGSYGYVKQ